MELQKRQDSRSFGSFDGWIPAVPPHSTVGWFEHSNLPELRPCGQCRACSTQKHPRFSNYDLRPARQSEAPAQTRGCQSLEEKIPSRVVLFCFSSFYAL